MTESNPPMQRLEEALVEDRRATDVAQLVLSGLDVPLIAPVLRTWIGQHGQRKRLERIREVLVLIEDRVSKLEEAGEPVTCDEEWAELTTENLRRAARTRSSQKRERFANLLANGARESDSQRREEAQTMSRLLHELEYRQVQLLDATVLYSRRGATRGLPLTAPDVLYGPSDAEKIDEGTEGRIEMDIARLTTLGLAENDIPGLMPQSADSPPTLDLVPTRLGRALHSWIREPAETADSGQRPPKT